LFAVFDVRRLRAALPLLCAGVLASAAPLPDTGIRWNVSTTNQAVEVFNLPPAAVGALTRQNWPAEQWQNLFAVYAEQGNIAIDLWLPSMSGSYATTNGLIVFFPQFPLQPEVTYRAVFDPSKLPAGNGVTGKVVSSTFRLPRAGQGPSTVISAVYPSADELPENLLKFYLQFSAPMSRGHTYDYIHLLDDTGKAVELPFLEINEELWDRTMTRLTLFLDPGRIKRGVKPLEEVGPALLAGRTYTLVIDDSWTDAEGNHLKTGVRKVFKVGPPDRDAIDLDKWRIEPPKADSREPLVVAFPKPLDQALARRMIHARPDGGAPVSGQVELLNQEREWRFVPTNPWAPGRYALSVETTIEDLAGNNIGKPFEVDLFDKVQSHLTNQIVARPFTVR